MKKCLAALFAMVLLCGVSQASDGESTANVFSNYAAGWQKLTQVNRQVHARMLCKLLHKGMTVKQVEQILGQASMDSLGLSGCCIYGSYSYHDHGLYVSFFGDENGVLRMTEVHFWPLLP